MKRPGRGEVTLLADYATFSSTFIPHQYYLAEAKAKTQRNVHTAENPDTLTWVGRDA